MKSKTLSLRAWLLAFSAGSFLSITLSVQATEYTYDNNLAEGIQVTSGNWATGATNWTTDGGVTRVGWPNTGTDSAAFIGTPAADITVSVNSPDIQLDDLTSSLGAGRFCYFNQVSSPALIRTLTLTGGAYDGTGTTGSQFNILTGNFSMTGALGTTQFKITGDSDIVKRGPGGLFITSVNHDYTGKIHILEGSLFFNSGNETSLGNPENDIIINGGTLNLQTNALTLGSQRTITLGTSGGKIGGGVALTLQGPITGPGTLEKVNSGVLVLEAPSTYTGATTTITAGTLRLQANGTIPDTSNVIVNGGTNSFFNVRTTNNWVYNGTISGDGTAQVTLNTGTNATLAGPISGLSAVVANNIGTNATVSGPISGTVAVTVANSATLRLSGTNTYSGATTINSGTTLIINGNNSGATAPVTVNAGGTLAGSGTIGSLAAISGIHAPGGDVSGVQTFTGGLDYAADSILSVNLGTNSAAPGLRGTHPLGYGGADVTANTLNIDPAATGRVALNTTTGDVNLSNPFWNTSQKWLVVDVKGSATAADTNAPLPATATLNGSPFSTAAYGNFTFSRAAGSTTQDAVWLNWTPATHPTWTGAGGSSWATAGNWSPTAPTAGGIVRFHTASTNNLNTVLGADFDLLGLAVISPAGPVSVGGANTLTLGAGGIDLAFANQNLSVTTPLAVSAAQSWTVASGRTLNVNGPVSGEFPVTIGGTGTVSLGGTVAPLVGLTVSSGSTLRMAASGLLSSDASAVNPTVNGTLDLNGTKQAVNLIGGSGVIDNTAAGPAELTVGANDVVGTLSTLLQNTNGPLTLVKTGVGNLTLPGANSHTGGLRIDSTGSVYPQNNAAFGSGPVVLNGGRIYATAGSYTFANPLTLNDGNLRVGGGNSRTLTWNGPVVATGASSLNADGGTGGITLGSTLDITGADFTSSANGTTHTILGNVSGAGGNMNVTLGTLQLAGTNTYTGTTTLSGSAVLRLQPTGTISNSSNVVINGTGNFNVRNTAGWVYTGTITGEGTGSINLNTATNATLAGPISGVATVVANNPGTDATVSGPISGPVAVSIFNTATLRLGGANSYTGATTLTSGTLVLAANNVLPDASPVTIAAATLDAATFTDTAGTLAVTGAATIRFGAGAALAFADSSALEWTGTGLNLTGFVSGSSLRFGTSNTSLTPAQLALISAPGFENFALNSSGFLTATFSGTPFDTWASVIPDPTKRGRLDDADGDGLTNLQEFLFGTSPIVGSGSLVTTTTSGGNLTLRWLQRETGATYTVQQSTTLLANSWTNLASPLPAMDANQTGAPADYDFYTVTVPSNSGRLFLRVEAEEN